MTSPEDALARARSAATAKRETGGYAGVSAGDGPLDATIHSGRAPVEVLSRWAVIEVDSDVLYSTRRAGAPVTALKRVLRRLMRQYLIEIESRQTRFNLALLAAFQELDGRVGRLEAELDGRGADARE